MLCPDVCFSNAAVVKSADRVKQMIDVRLGLESRP